VEYKERRTTRNRSNQVWTSELILLMCSAFAPTIELMVFLVKHYFKIERGKTIPNVILFYSLIDLLTKNKQSFTAALHYSTEHKFFHIHVILYGDNTIDLTKYNNRSTLLWCKHSRSKCLNKIDAIKFTNYIKKDSILFYRSFKMVKK